MTTQYKHKAGNRVQIRSLGDKFSHLHSKRNPISGGKRNRKEDWETEIWVIYTGDFTNRQKIQNKQFWRIMFYIEISEAFSTKKRQATKETSLKAWEVCHCEPTCEPMQPTALSDSATASLTHWGSLIDTRENRSHEGNLFYVCLTDNIPQGLKECR